LGCCPRFNTPGHPEASGMVERFNQTYKNMLAHVVQQRHRQWHKFVPFMMWALREVLIANTGVSPFKLVYGRVPRGPLAILKESWAGERELPSTLSQPVEEYLRDLRCRMEDASQFAADHTSKAQAKYVSRYNLRARPKQCFKGDQVVVLAPDAGGKLCNKWQGPGTIQIVRSIITPANVVMSVNVSARIEEDKLSHLDNQQRGELLQLIDEFSDRFTDKPGLCEAVVHHIQTTADFVPLQMKPYRVPEVYKPEVDRQIDELLRMGLIRPSNSPMASPIVCVA